MKTPVEVEYSISVKYNGKYYGFKSESLLHVNGLNDLEKRLNEFNSRLTEAMKWKIKEGAGK